MKIDRTCRLVFACFVIAPLLAGCLRFSLETLQKTTPAGTPFQKALTREYQRLSEKEAALYDWVEAEHFARKGLRAAGGEAVAPDDPENRSIADTMLSSVMEARRQLISIVTDAVKEKHPQESAQAQAAYECWIEELEEEWQIEHITACRDDFFALINLLSLETEEEKSAAKADERGNAAQKEKASKPASEVQPKKSETPKAPVPALKPEEKTQKPANHTVEEVKKTSALPIITQTPEEKKEPAIQDDSAKKARKARHPAQEKPAASKSDSQVSYEVYFDVNSTEITEAAHNIIDQIVRAYKDTDNKVILNGYTDHAGNPRYNLTLSKLRAIAVKRELERQGFPPERLSLFAFGEQDVKEENGNGKEKKQSRRVHIIIE